MIFSFYLKKPPLVVVQDQTIKDYIIKIISSHFKYYENKVPFFQKIILILEPIKKIKFFIRNSKLPVIVSNSETKELRSYLPPNGYLVLNYDKESFGKEVLANILTYGFEKGADFLITDLNFLNKEVNFKINYRGSTIPFWIKNIEEKKEVYLVLAAIVTCFCLDLNLVEISKALQIDK